MRFAVIATAALSTFGLTAATFDKDCTKTLTKTDVKWETKYEHPVTKTKTDWVPVCYTTVAKHETKTEYKDVYETKTEYKTPTSTITKYKPTSTATVTVTETVKKCYDKRYGGEERSLDERNLCDIEYKTEYKTLYKTVQPTEYCTESKCLITKTKYDIDYATSTCYNTKYSTKTVEAHPVTVTQYKDAPCATVTKTKTEVKYTGKCEKPGHY